MAIFKALEFRLGELGVGQVLPSGEPQSGFLFDGAADRYRDASFVAYAILQLLAMFFNVTFDFNGTRVEYGQEFSTDWLEVSDLLSCV
jgi:hypothetical protein